MTSPVPDSSSLIPVTPFPIPTQTRRRTAARLTTQTHSRRRNSPHQTHPTESRGSTGRSSRMVACRSTPVRRATHTVVRRSRASGNELPDNTEFVSEPAVLSNREKYALQRDGQRFFVDGTAIRSLFGQSDFTVIWSLPLPERKSATDSSNASIPWPAISERITWSELFLAEKSPARPTPESRMPDWTLDVGRLQMTASGGS